jgi:LysM repeat protein
MKILKIFGLVVGIHVFALILIFANPGCSSTSKPTPAPADTIQAAEAPSSVSVPYNSPMTVSPGFNPDAPATASGSVSDGRYRPTRPNTPAAGAMTAAPVTDITPATTYLVKSGDTLWELGKKYHVPYTEIAAANGIKSGTPLHAGQKLIIPTGKVSGSGGSGVTTKAGGAANTAKAPARAAASTTNSGSNALHHTVKLGETLSGIAKQYGVSTKELGTVNNISDPAKIKPGMELVIPGWKAPGGSSAAKSAAQPAETAQPAPAAATPEPKTIFNLDAGAPKTAEPPVIKVDDNPLTPAPKSN